MQTQRRRGGAGEGGAEALAGAEGEAGGEAAGAGAWLRCTPVEEL